MRRNGICRPAPTAQRRGRVRFCHAALFAGAFVVGQLSSAAATGWDFSADDDRVDYDREIRPILSEKCFRCHGPDEGARQAGLRLDRAADAAAVLFVPQGEQALLVERITSEDSEERMPPADSELHLQPSEIDLLLRWVDQGAPYTPLWSLQPVVRHRPPPNPHPGWSEHPIDRFVYAAMRSHGLFPSPAADRVELVRRVAFDLTGLPPTIEELDRFTSDERDNAYELMVDYYLSRPAYGERLAFHWMEVARYADSYGYQVDRDRVVWQWRDWVIRAFNENIPFDQFVTEQLAGDLLPNPTDDQILATAFNRLHPQKVEGGSTEEEFRVEYVADRVQTFATAFLGMTLECARCHNHKFDPISQREYYQLYAFFNNIDEAGLHSYFTEAIPTPTLLLADGAAKARIAELSGAADNAEKEWHQARQDRREAFSQWLAGLAESAGELVPPAPIAALDFEQPPNEPNRSIAGVRGSACELTGDDEIPVPVGNFQRHQPFSVALWMRCPDEKKRAVVFHRSRAWTDAGSRGYELLLEDGRLSAALIHFWPGNAIRIRSHEPIPLKQWIHVGMTYDGSSRAAGLKLYVDGRLVPCDVVRDQLSKEITGGGGDNIAIGARFRDSGFKGGAVDEFHVFDRELTDMEIGCVFDDVSLSQTIERARSESHADSIEACYEFFLRAVDSESKDRLQRLSEARKVLNAFVEAIPEIMVMREMTPQRQTYVLNRGAYDAPTDPVDAQTPAMLPPMAGDLPYNRLGLARWLTAPENPRTARVAVNQMWQMIFGQGLVRTPEDFGSQGEAPTHPELLDWLASDFVDSGWNVKHLLKQMILSSTYRQSARATAEALAADPNNRWLSRTNRRRLDAEMLRDSVVAVSGLLDPKIGGPSVKPYELAEAFHPMAPETDGGLYRRTLYTHWKRNSPPPVMVTLDAVRREVCTVRRDRTSTPLQAIVLLNDPQRIEAARVLAVRSWSEYTADPAAAIAHMFRALTSHFPNREETSVLLQLLAEQRKYYEDQKALAEQLLSIGQTATTVDPEDVATIAALTIVASTIMNMDACVTRH